MSIRIIHAADLHLDPPFEGLPPEKAAQRRAELRRLPAQLAGAARRRQADLLLLAGDIFDGTRVYPETGEAFADALADLGIPVFIAPGNHDFYSLRSPWARLKLPENVHVFTSPRLECAALDTLGVRVWGAGYDAASCPGLLRDFRPEKVGGVLDILVLHAEVGRPGSPYCPVTVEELERSGFDYAALGHVHTCSGLRRAGECCYAWPGCPAGRGFDECGPKGALFVELSAEECSASFLPLGQREYRTLTVDAGADIAAALPADAAEHIYRITLTGECEQAPDPEAIRAGLSPLVYDLTLIDETRPAEDLWAHLEDDTLRGVFLRRMRSRLNAARGDERDTVLAAARLGLAALEGREGPL